MKNINGDMVNVTQGDLIHGTVTYNSTSRAYYVFTEVTGSVTGNTSFTIPVQKTLEGVYKNYTIAYVVFEKKAKKCS